MIKNYFRLNPGPVFDPKAFISDQDHLDSFPDFSLKLRPGDHVFVGQYDSQMQLGEIRLAGRVMKAGQRPEIEWRFLELDLRPSPAGRIWWSKVSFRFADAVAERYLLEAVCDEAFEGIPMPEPLPLRREQLSDSTRELRPASDDPGYVYVIRSQYGFKIGKSRRLKERTRLFEVKLPFPISVEMTGWFPDYSLAERRFHLKFHQKRLEGEWFDLSKDDLVELRGLLAQGDPK